MGCSVPKAPQGLRDILHHNSLSSAHLLIKPLPKTEQPRPASGHIQHLPLCRKSWASGLCKGRLSGCFCTARGGQTPWGNCKDAQYWDKPKHRTWPHLKMRHLSTLGSAVSEHLNRQKKEGESLKHFLRAPPFAALVQVPHPSHHYGFLLPICLFTAGPNTNGNEIFWSHCSPNPIELPKQLLCATANAISQAAVRNCWQNASHSQRNVSLIIIIDINSRCQT